MYRDNVLSVLTKPTRKVIDSLRACKDFKEYGRTLAIKMDIDTKTGFWSNKLCEKNQLIKSVRASLDLVRDYMTIVVPKKAIRVDGILTDAEMLDVNELTMRMINASNEQAQVDVPEDTNNAAALFA